ncbi:MAG: efflux RND transporter periplasmic adaptor subunit [Proteobacteria bacterium]|nr:efflux RND transporter periplasmic adaptor subunit [Pseudomonadota bacterium]
MPQLSLIIALVASIALTAMDCGKKETAATGPAPEVVVAPVEQKDVEIFTDWVGTTTGFVNAQIYPKIQGYLLKQSDKDGSVVAAGELLFEIDARQYQAALGRAQAALGKSELDVARYTPLVAEGAVSRQELDDAIQARAANRAEVDSAKAGLENAQLNLAWTKVQAPIGGIAAIATAQVGDLVSPQTLLTTVSQLEPIKVTFPISEIEYLKYAKRIREHQQSGSSTSEPTLSLILADGSLYPHLGRFYVTGLEVAQTTGTITVQGEFPNPENLLRPGQFAKVRAATERILGALVIPQRAVSDMQGASLVAVVDADNKVTQKRVKLGPQTGSDYVIREGLTAGDRVVVEGLQKIRNGMVVKPVTAEERAAATPASPAPAAK